MAKQKYFLSADIAFVLMFGNGLSCQRQVRLNVASHFYVPIKDFLNGCQPPPTSPVRFGQPYPQNIQGLLLQFNIKI